jgi:hypothetical protein
MLWLRPWGFPTVSPSHPNILPHHEIRQISVESTEDSRITTLLANLHRILTQLVKLWSFECQDIPSERREDGQNRCRRTGGGPHQPRR